MAVDEHERLHLELPALPENVARVRHTVARHASSRGLPPALVDDLKLIVSEGCSNVVLHAYEDGDPGPMEVELAPRNDRLRVRIKDRGAGIRPEHGAEMPTLDVGLAMIALLSSRFSLRSEIGLGTTLEIEISLTEPARFL